HDGELGRGVAKIDVRRTDEKGRFSADVRRARQKSADRRVRRGRQGRHLAARVYRRGERVDVIVDMVVVTGGRQERRREAGPVPLRLGEPHVDVAGDHQRGRVRGGRWGDLLGRRLRGERRLVGGGRGGQVQ